MPGRRWSVAKPEVAIAATRFLGGADNRASLGADGAVGAPPSYAALGFDGCSPHSGRRTFITQAARNIWLLGGSLRDLQMLARHSSLNMTQPYLERDTEAMRKVVEW